MAKSERPGSDTPGRQIGQWLDLAEKAVENQISRVVAKLGTEWRIQAAVIATPAQSAQLRGRADAAPLRQ